MMKSQDKKDVQLLTKIEVESGACYCCPVCNNTIISCGHYEAPELRDGQRNINFCMICGSRIALSDEVCTCYSDIESLDVIKDRSNIIFFAIYEKPSDYPDKFVMRLWATRNLFGRVECKPYNKIFLADNLEDLRKILPANKFIRFGPQGDDTCIETWLKI